MKKREKLVEREQGERKGGFGGQEEGAREYSKEFSLCSRTHGCFLLLWRSDPLADMVIKSNISLSITLMDTPNFPYMGTTISRQTNLQQYFQTHSKFEEVILNRKHINQTFSFSAAAASSSSSQCRWRRWARTFRLDLAGTFCLHGSESV